MGKFGSIATLDETPLQVRLRADQHAGLRALAAFANVTPRELVREAIDEFLHKRLRGAGDDAA